MFACKKCRHDLTDGAAQQSFSELETALRVRNSAIAAHRKAMKAGPLCEPCLALWQSEHADELRPPLVPDTRSPAIKRLDDACAKL